MIPAGLLAVLKSMVESAIASAEANPLDFARSVVDLALELVPDQDLKSFLDDAAKRRVEAAADAAEDAKFPR